jgi:anti-sigma regulatory factor (Ser/Thr protein kinase)
VNEATSVVVAPTPCTGARPTGKLEAMTAVRRIPNRLSELRSLSTWAVDVAKGLGCSAERCHEVDLCLTEAVSNIIRHGYHDDKRHEIRVELARVSNALVVRIEDDAQAFDPLGKPGPEPTSLEDAPKAGRGLVLLRSAPALATYEHRDGRNVLTLSFVIAA